MKVYYAIAWLWMMKLNNAKIGCLVLETAYAVIYKILLSHNDDILTKSVAVSSRSLLYNDLNIAADFAWQFILFCGVKIISVNAEYFIISPARIVFSLRAEI